MGDDYHAGYRHARDGGSTDNWKDGAAKSGAEQYRREQMVKRAEANIRASGGNRQNTTDASCFVATACFEGADHPTVETLRGFRDRVLSESKAGRAFVRTYYRFGPIAARFVNRHPAMKPALRKILSSVGRLVGDSE